MRNKPLKGLMRKSGAPKTNIKDYAKMAVKALKPIAGKAVKKALGPIGLVLGATSTATADNVTDPKTGVNKYTGKKTYEGGSMF